MTPIDRIVTFRVDAEMLDAMEALKDRDGIPYSEQIRRALRAWLAEKGVLQAARKAGTTPRSRA